MAAIIEVASATKDDPLRLFSGPCTDIDVETLGSSSTAIDSNDTWELGLLEDSAVYRFAGRAAKRGRGSRWGMCRWGLGLRPGATSRDATEAPLVLMPVERMVGEPKFQDPVLVGSVKVHLATNPPTMSEYYRNYRIRQAKETQ